MAVMSVLQIVLCGVWVCAGMLLQSSVGFGLGLFAVPLMLLVGVRMELAMAMLPMISLVQCGWNAWAYREHIPWRAVWGLTAWRLAGLGPGLGILAVLAAGEQATAKQVIGGVLLLILAVQWLAKVRPVERVHGTWAVAAGVSSGVMAGAFGMGGPPVVLWAAAHDWPGRVNRSFLWTTFLLLMPPWAVLLAWRYGWPAIEAMAISMVYVPFVLIAAQIGSKLGDRLNRHGLRAAARWLLVAIALSAIAGPWVW
jgi:hypothetical protein